MSTPEVARGIPGGEVLIALGGDLYAARPDGTARRHLTERVTGADWVARRTMDRLHDVRVGSLDDLHHDGRWH